MNRTFNNRSKQTGISLIEVLIASLLGLLLINGVIQIFSSTSTSYRFTENMSRAQENGRFAIDIISRYTRMGGYATFQTVGNTPTPFAEPGCAAVSGRFPCVSEGTGVNGSDRIAIQLDAPDNRDCNNNVVADNSIIRNVFWIEEDPANQVATLYCQGFDIDTGLWIGAQQPYIAGIDSMQVLYGITDGGTDLARFVNANNVTNWALVKAIKISVLAQSGLDDNANANAKNYVLLDNAPLQIDDGRNRFVFSTTVHIANSI